MKKIKVKCPRCGQTVEGEVNRYLINPKHNPTFIYRHYAYCKECDYHITESEWEEIKE